MDRVVIRTRNKCMAVGETCVAIFWPAHRLNGGEHLWALSSQQPEGTLISASAVPHIVWLINTPDMDSFSGHLHQEQWNTSKDEWNDFYAVFWASLRQNHHRRQWHSKSSELTLDGLSNFLFWQNSCSLRLITEFILAWLWRCSFNYHNQLKGREGERKREREREKHGRTVNTDWQGNPRHGRQR